MEKTVRVALSEDEPILWTMLMHAAHETSLAAVKDNPALSRYVQGWGRTGDLGVVAEQAGVAMGAAWLRLSADDAPDNRGYGYVDSAIPELAIAVLPTHRGEGIGTMLLTEIMVLAPAKFPAISLSVRADNPAVKLYERIGFVPVIGTDVINRTGGHSFTMLRKF